MGGCSVVSSRHFEEKLFLSREVASSCFRLFMLSKLQKIVKVFTMGRKGGYYAVRTGRRTGVFRTWYEFCLTTLKTTTSFQYFHEREGRQFMSSLGSFRAVWLLLTLSTKLIIEVCTLSFNPN